MKTLAALLCGTLFGFGLALGGMMNPAKVIGFLDVTGAWDPSLAFVMGTALLITIPSFYLARRGRAQPLLAQRFGWPERQSVDRRLLGGAVLFGVGWGITGLCPGPALASLVTGLPLIVLFVTAMFGGMWLHDKILTPSR